MKLREIKLCTYLKTSATYIIICNHTLHVSGERRRAEGALMQCHTVSKESRITPLLHTKCQTGFNFFSFCGWWKPLLQG